MADRIPILPTHIQAAAGVVTNEQQQILLVKNNRDGWVMPGGMVENGETLLAGVKREIFEETGVTVSVEELYCLSSNLSSHPGYNGVEQVPTKVVADFTCRYLSGEIRPSKENAETQWVSLEEASQLIAKEPFKSRFACYLSYRGRPSYLAYQTYPTFTMVQKQII